jgi:hypothetical protein
MINRGMDASRGRTGHGHRGPGEPGRGSPAQTEENFMTDMSQARVEAAQPPQETLSGPPAEYRTSRAGGMTGWSGWIVFAAVMLMLLGAFQIIEGLIAVFDDGFYQVSSNGLAVHVNYNAWGWLHFSIGVVAILVGLGLMTGNIVARVLGVVIGLTSAILNLGFIPAYPVWSTIMIALDVIIIYAIIAHGSELKI